MPTSQTEASGQPKQEQHHQSKELTEKERRRLERLYRLGDKPAILIHPNRSARGGRFDCHRVSLHSLLNYQAEEQQKELNFEVSLFAEQFHTMMQRDCAFSIFRGIYSAPEKDGKYEAKFCATHKLLVISSVSEVRRSASFIYWAQNSFERISRRELGL